MLEVEEIKKKTSMLIERVTFCSHTYNKYKMLIDFYKLPVF